MPSQSSESGESRKGERVENGDNEADLPVGDSGKHEDSTTVKTPFPLRKALSNDRLTKNPNGVTEENVPGRKSAQQMSSPPSRLASSTALHPLHEHEAMNGMASRGQLDLVDSAIESSDMSGTEIDEVDELGISMSSGPNYINGRRNSEASASSYGTRKGSDDRGKGRETEKVLKLSPSRIQELTSLPESLPLRVASPPEVHSATFPEASRAGHGWTISGALQTSSASDCEAQRVNKGKAKVLEALENGSASRRTAHDVHAQPSPKDRHGSRRPVFPHRTLSTPPATRRRSSNNLSGQQFSHSPGLSRRGRALPPLLPLEDAKSTPENSSAAVKALPSPEASPLPASIPLPPWSIPTYLQLELSASRPSPLYIHRSITSDFPYESSRIKFERLLNFLLLPPQLEAVLWFGALACADAWLYTFTILPLRFLKALSVLCQWWATTLLKEARDIGSFIYWGLGRMWQRHQLGTESMPPTPAPEAHHSRRASMSGKPGINGSPAVGSQANGEPTTPPSYFSQERGNRRRSSRRHRKTKSTPSALLPNHKADLLKGLVVLFSCMVLMKFDASRMYHGIRGQAAIKLYVIYNVLECCDRLFSALGQDVFECLFSRETLERKPNGRSKLLRPFGMFLLALAYNVIHSTALFYQVVTLNVAVNSYSNALLTLLMSNQFVEIKSTVFKKFEKENLFQLTCADVVERFQLWLMLLIIAMRNIVEVGGLSLGGLSGMNGNDLGGLPGAGASASGSAFSSSSILPKSFTIFPIWTGQVLGPFMLVLGSEMLVDWLKHAYITKFNNTKPSIYGRFLDVLSKDYYSNAFADQNLTRRLGLPVLPLSCLFIRAAIQTYHMLLATHFPQPIASPSTSLAINNSSATSTSPATTAALAHVDTVIRRALGRSSFGAGSSPSDSLHGRWHIDMDDVIAFVAMLLFFLGIYLVMLATKLVLGMGLLSFARARYKGMKERERESADVAGGRRIGGWGVVEVDDDKKRWIYKDDVDGWKRVKQREKDSSSDGRDNAAVTSGGELAFGAVSRYTMVGKRIW